MATASASKKPRIYGRTVPVGGSRLRGISPDRQRPLKARSSGKLTWIRDVETVLARMRAGIRNTKHPLYQAIADTRGSDRKIRSEGLDNLDSVLHGLVSHAIAGRWMIGKQEAEVAGLKIFHRWSIEDLDERIFGEEIPMERSIKRTWRALASLRAAGILVSFPQSREEVMLEDGTVKLHTPVAFRFLTEEFFLMLGLTYLITKGLARSFDRAKGEQREQRIGRHRGERPDLRVPLEPGERLGADPIPTGPPPPEIRTERYTDVARDHVLAILESFRHSK